MGGAGRLMWPHCVTMHWGGISDAQASLFVCSEVLTAIRPLPVLWYLWQVPLWGANSRTAYGAECCTGDRELRQINTSEAPYLDSYYYMYMYIYIFIFTVRASHNDTNDGINLPPPSLWCCVYVHVRSCVGSAVCVCVCVMAIIVPLYTVIHMVLWSLFFIFKICNCHSVCVTMSEHVILFRCIMHMVYPVLYMYGTIIGL